nr:putative nad(p)h-dependent d-xylose reductase xyl1 [Quercus suber]
MSPNTMSEDDRRELIARQHRALYGDSASLYAQDGSRSASQSGDARGSSTGRGPSPLAFDSFGVNAQPGAEGVVQMPPRDRAENASSPASASAAQQPSFSLLNEAQTSARTSNSSPGASPPLLGSQKNGLGGVAPIGTRPQQAPGAAPGLSKRSTTPLTPSSLSYGFSAEQNAGHPKDERSTSAASNPGMADKGVPGLSNWGSNSAVWGSGKNSLAVQPSGENRLGLFVFFHDDGVFGLSAFHTPSPLLSTCVDLRGEIRRGASCVDYGGFCFLGFLLLFIAQSSCERGKIAPNQGLVPAKPALRSSGMKGDGMNRVQMHLRLLSVLPTALARISSPWSPVRTHTMSAAAPSGASAAAQSSGSSTGRTTSPKPPGGPATVMRRKAAADRADKVANARPASTRAAGAGGSSNTMLRLYTDESPGLKVDPFVVMVLSIGFIISVVALHIIAKVSKRNCGRTIARSLAFTPPLRIRTYANMTTAPTTKLNNGKEMPLVGFGLWKVTNETCADTVYNAIKTGYRLFDGACDYGNEVEAGQGVKRAIDEGLVKREQLFIVSKLWNSFHDRERVKPIAQKQLADWGIDYFDLFIIHFPIALKYVDPSVRYPPGFFYENDQVALSKATLEETYHAMEALYDEGLIRAIGVSNYTGTLLLDVERYAKVLPQTLQIEHHPYLVQQDLLELCRSRNIAVTAYSSFGPQSFLELNLQKARDAALLFDHDTITSIAAKHGKTPAQVLLRWATQRGVAVIPKSNNQGRLQQNLDVCGFDLASEEIEKISSLDQGLRFNNPLNYGVPIPIFA